MALSPVTADVTRVLWPGEVSHVVDVNSSAKVSRIPSETCLRTPADGGYHGNSRCRVTMAAEMLSPSGMCSQEASQSEDRTRSLLPDEQESLSKSSSEMSISVNKAFVIERQYGQTQLPQNKVKRGIHPPASKNLPGIYRYTRKQVQKMGNRVSRSHTSADRQPASKAGSARLEQETAKCSVYEAWLSRKKATTEHALETICLDDLKQIQQTCKPGEVDVALCFNDLGQNYWTKRVVWGPRPSIPERGSVCLPLYRQASVLEGRFRAKASYLESKRPSLRKDDPYRLHHTGDKLLDAVFDLYMTEARHMRRQSHNPVPEMYEELFDQAGLKATPSNVKLFIKDVAAAMVAKDVSDSSTCLKHRKSAVVQKPAVLSSVLNRMPVAKTGFSLPAIDSPLTSIMEGPEFPFSRCSTPAFKMPAAPYTRNKSGVTWGTDYGRKSTRYKSRRFTCRPGARFSGEFDHITDSRRSSFCTRPQYGKTQARDKSPTRVGLQELSMLSKQSLNVVNLQLDKDKLVFEKEFYKRMQAQAQRRKSTKIRKRWWHAFMLLKAVMKFSSKMSQRSFELDQQLKTFVDIGDAASASVDYGGGRSINTEMYKRRKEITINAEVRATLRAPPHERTLGQLDQAMRELQKVQVFSEYPVQIQEKMIRKAFYLALGPKRVIVRQGQTPQYFFIIVSGEAMTKEISIHPSTGEAQALTDRLLWAGMTFGEIAIIQNRNRSASVVSRANMQLLAVDADDFYDIFILPHEDDTMLPHMSFISSLDIMQEWPCEILPDHPSLCTLHFFRRNTVITHDSHASAHLYIVKTGYCKVFRYLDWVDQPYDSTDADSPWLWDEPGRRQGGRQDETELSELMMDSSRRSARYNCWEYLEPRKSEHVQHRETRTPRGHRVLFPVTKPITMRDPMETRTLRLPPGPRKFVPIHTLHETDVFGLDQMPIYPHRGQSRTVILVSLGAECIALHKGFYCRHASKWTHEVVRHKAFIYDDRVINSRLSGTANRDVHLEAVLDNHFRKLRLGS